MAKYPAPLPIPSFSSLSCLSSAPCMGLYLGIQCPSLMRIPPDEYPVRPAVYLVPEILLFGIRLSKLFPHAVPDVSLPSPAVDSLPSLFRQQRILYHG